MGAAVLRNISQPPNLSNAQLTPLHVSVEALGLEGREGPIHNHNLPAVGATLGHWLRSGWVDAREEGCLARGATQSFRDPCSSV